MLLHTAQMEVSLRPYQEEVVQPALRGENTIIWLPTGGGKTRAAVYVAKKHLEAQPRGKVAVLVNKVHLVDQHYQKEFLPYLRGAVRVVPISGDSREKDFFGRVVKDSDLVICTAQILENALINTEEDKHVELTDFTLLIIDECHHTHKRSVYNKIMTRYVEKKLEGAGPLPQILGLTASPGTGRARTLEGAVAHVLKICANLDSFIVFTKLYKPVLTEAVPTPVKKYDIVEEQILDPFGLHLKMMMGLIHDFISAEMKIVLREMGTQEYEADVVELEKKGAQEENRLVAQCARHLRKYNDALLIKEAVRMVDALRLLENFYSSRRDVMLDTTDIFLSALFEENRVELRQLSADVNYENPKLGRLQRTLVEQFQDRESRGIVFAKTRVGTHCLCDWVCANPELQRANIRAAVLTGAGTGANHMTQNGQKETIQMFRNGGLNLLISTSVAEEGLDIPECNVVVRYGLLTNEIAQQQASGRARAKDSVYSVVALRGGREIRREVTNEYLEDLTGRAIAQIHRMEPREFREKVLVLQREAMKERLLDNQRSAQRKQRYSAALVAFACRGCFTTVAHGDHIRVVNSSQYVNINPDFRKFYEKGNQVCLERSFEDWEPGHTISCASCGQDWGMEIKIRKVLVLPCVKIKGFLVKSPQSSRTLEQWKDVEFPVEEFDFLQFVSDMNLN